MSATPLRESVLAPEGVELHFATAGGAERSVAFAIDLAVLLVSTILIGLLFGLTFGNGGVYLAAFFIRNGYFVFFEARSNGRTLGKRLYHLRVIRADGGPLTTEVLLARNLTREVELFLPLTALLNPDLLFAEHSGLIRLTASLWILLLLFFPLFNARRLRIGDLLAGTRVVISPPMPLLGDLAARKEPDAKRTGREESEPATGLRFSSRQLEIYGEHELKVLEDVLRKRARPGGADALRAVTTSICRRIGYDVEAIDGRYEPFLRAFYREQRAHLEQRLALGRRRLHKESKKGEELPE